LEQAAQDLYTHLTKIQHPNSADSWGISSNAASNSYTPAYSDLANTYPMRTIEVHKNNVSLSASIPSGGVEDQD
jgi:hypothetical protein